MAEGKSSNTMIRLFCGKSGKSVWHNSVTKKDGVYRCTCCGTERNKSGELTKSSK